MSASLSGAAPTGTGAGVTALAFALHQGLDGAHVQILRDDLLRQRFGVLAADQSPSVAGGQHPSGHAARAPTPAVSEAQRVGDVAAALADHLGQLLLGITEALDQIVITGRLLDGVKVAALHVFDQRNLEQLLVAQLTDDSGT